MSVRLLFSTNQGIGARTIRLFTWSRYSHVDLILENRETLIAALAFRGVTAYGLEERLRKSTDWAIYTVDAPFAPVFKYVYDQIGKPYDWTACFGVGLHRDWQQDDAWDCSELIGYAMLKAGTPLLNPEVRVNRITPEMLLHSPLLKLEQSSNRPTVVGVQP